MQEIQDWGVVALLDAGSFWQVQIRARHLLADSDGAADSHATAQGWASLRATLAVNLGRRLIDRTRIGVLPCQRSWLEQQAPGGGRAYQQQSPNIGS